MVIVCVQIIKSDNFTSTVLTVVAVYNMDTPGSGAISEDSVCSLSHPKTDTSVAPTKCILSRFNLHHPVLKFLVCVDVGDSLYIVHIWFSSQVSKLVYLVYWSALGQILC